MSRITSRLAAVALSFLLGGFAAGQDEKKEDPPRKDDKPSAATKAREAMKKLKEAEDEYRKARREAAVALDAALAEAIAEAEKSYKAALAAAKDVEARQKAMQARQKAMTEIQQLRSARMRLETSSLGPAVPPVPPEESRLHARLDPVTAVLAAQLKLEKGTGLLVGTVRKGGTAEKAGLKANDILVELDGKPVPSDTPRLRKLLATIKPGTAVTAAVLREGKREEIKEWTLPAAGGVK